MSAPIHTPRSDDKEHTDGAEASHPAGDIELKPAREISLRRVVLAGLMVGAVSYAAGLDTITYSVAGTTCCP